MCTDSNRFYLPALWAFLGKLCEVHRSIWVFLLMLLSACLHKVGIWGHFASGLLWILTHLVLLKREKGNCAISGECFAFTLLIAVLFAIRVFVSCIYCLKSGGGRGGVVIDNSLYKATWCSCIILPSRWLLLETETALPLIHFGAATFQKTNNPRSIYSDHICLQM